MTWCSLTDRGRFAIFCRAIKRWSGHGEQESNWIRGTFVERKSRVEAQVTGPVFLRSASSFGFLLLSSLLSRDKALMVQRLSALRYILLANSVLSMHCTAPLLSVSQIRSEVTVGPLFGKSLGEKKDKKR